MMSMNKDSPKDEKGTKTCKGISYAVQHKIKELEVLSWPEHEIKNKVIDAQGILLRVS